jgi:hypothetical protein
MKVLACPPREPHVRSNRSSRTYRRQSPRAWEMTIVALAGACSAQSAVERPAPPPVVEIAEKGAAPEAPRADEDTQGVDAEALCEKAVARMSECLPALIDATIRKHSEDLPDEAKALLESMKEKMEEGMREAVADMQRECATAARGKVASDGEAVKACLERDDCEAFNACMERAGRANGDQTAR